MLTKPFCVRDFRVYSEGDGGGAGATTSGQEPQPPASTAGQPNDPASSGSGSVDIEALKRETAEARREAAKYRTERNSFEAELKKRQEAEMTEAERFKTQAEEATGKLTAMEKRIVKSEARLAAQKAGIVDPDLAYLAIADGIEMKEGEPVNLEALIGDLVKTKPYLIGSTVPSGAGAGAANPARGGAAIQPQTYTAAQVSDRAFYKANQADILKAMAEGRIRD